MDLHELNIFLDNKNISYQKDVDLSKVTWIHRGGQARLFIKPSNSNELSDVVAYLYGNNIMYYLIGYTSNIYIHNSCNPDVIVSTRNCTHYEVSESHIVCECGVNVARLSKYLITNSIQGFEYLTRLPGTVGGAVYNNSSCESNCISDYLESVDFITTDGSIRSLSKKELKFNFRTSILKEQRLQGVVLNVYFKRVNGNSNSLSEIAAANEHNRKKYLEGSSKNLGCTVNRLFSLGKMPMRYKLSTFLYAIILKLLVWNPENRVQKRMNFLLWVSGYSCLKNYISDKLILTFIWKDLSADEYFPLYLDFMKKVYKTDKIEIEIWK